MSALMQRLQSWQQYSDWYPMSASNGTSDLSFAFHRLPVQQLTGGQKLNQLTTLPQLRQCHFPAAVLAERFGQGGGAVGFAVG